MALLSDCGFRRTYTLVAQTPMIHFQHSQEGATLRPSEVKPKLDRYLHSLMDPVPDAWLAPGQPTALRYQMRISAADCESRLRGLHVDDCKAYFGNMGKGTEEKHLVFSDCRLEIHCFIPELLAFLDRNIAGFFVLQNFGARQTKGFGGFLVDGTTPEDIRQILDSHFPHGFYADMPQDTDLPGRLNHALAVYNFMKNGTNQTRYRNGAYQFPGRYIKGYAMRAFLPENVGSDKAFLKARVVPAQTRRDKEDPAPYRSYTFIRALLGLSDRYEFRDDMRNGGMDPIKHRPRPATVNVLHFEGTEVRDGKPHIPEDSIRNGLGIKRFRSPILIKIFTDRIYFLLDDSWNIMLGQTFLMMPKRDFNTAAGLVRDRRFPEAQAMYQNAPFLQTPGAFDPAAFLEGFVAYFNENRGILAEFPETERPRREPEATVPGIYYPSHKLLLKIGGPKNG